MYTLHFKTKTNRFWNVNWNSNVLSLKKIYIYIYNRTSNLIDFILPEPNACSVLRYNSTMKKGPGYPMH